MFHFIFMVNCHFWNIWQTSIGLSQKRFRVLNLFVHSKLYSVKSILTVHFNTMLVFILSQSLQCSCIAFRSVKKYGSEFK